MPANVDGMVREGISAYRAGKKEEARTFLLKAVEIDEHNEQAWLWLSAVVDSPDEQQICLENVLAINPNNERARQGLQFLQQKSKPATTATRAEDVLASASFTAPPPAKTPPAASPFSTPAGDDEELPSSIEWDAPEAPTSTSSASSRRKVNEPSAADYDDWVSSLNLGGKSNSTLLDDTEDDDSFAPPVKANLDEMERFISSPAFDEDEVDELFGTDVGVRMPEDIFSSGPFSAAEPTVAPTPRREEKPKPAPPAAPKAAAPAKSPTSSRSAAPAKPDPLLDEVEAEDEEEFIADTDFDNDYDQMTLDAPDPTEMFGHIPQEIKATRLPGTNERYPILVILGFLVVLGLNAGAVALLVLRLTGKL